MRDDRKELLRRFYLQLELMCLHANPQARTGGAQRIGDLYDDEDTAPSLWERGGTRPFPFALHN